MTTLSYDAQDARYRRDETGSAPALFFGEWVEYRGGEVVRLVHGGGLDHVLAEVAEADVRQLLTDASNNVTHVSSSAPTVYERRYEAFGAVRSAQGPIAVERGFAGRPTEGSTGLLYLRARHYDPATGRFLQADPLGVQGDQLYAYAASNPLVFGDPLGLAPRKLQQDPIQATPLEDPAFWESISLRPPQVDWTGFERTDEEPRDGSLELYEKDVPSKGRYTTAIDRLRANAPGLLATPGDLKVMYVGREMWAQYVGQSMLVGTLGFRTVGDLTTSLGHELVHAVLEAVGIRRDSGGPNEVLHELLGSLWELQNAQWTEASPAALNIAFEQYRESLLEARKLYPTRFKGFPSGLQYRP